jgi:NitT/TauT family transport system substrate-binding protein
MLWSKAFSRRALIAGTAVLVAAAALAAAPAQAEKLKIVMPTNPTTFGIPHYIAIEKGWYAKDGLEVEDIHVQGDANAFRAMLGGEGDVCLVGPSTAMLGILKGSKVRTFGSWQPRVDYQFVTNKNKPAKFEKGLEGLTFAGSGRVSMLNHMVTMMMEKHGLNGSNIKHIAIGGHSDRLAAVIAGKADMTMVNTLTAQRAGDQVNIVAPVAKELGGMGYVYLVATEETLKNPAKHAALVKFMTGSTLGARFAMENVDYAAESLHKRAPESPLPLIKAIVADLNKNAVWGLNGGIPDEVTNFTAAAYKKYGVIERDMTADEVLDRSVVKAVISKIGTYKPKM